MCALPPPSNGEKIFLFILRDRVYFVLEVRGLQPSFMKKYIKYSHSNPRLNLPGSALLLALGALGMLTVPCRGLTLYDFGNPTADEQLYIELINRARADPAAEGKRIAATTDLDVLNSFSYFGVDLAMMQSEFNAIPAQPPLAPNACLETSSRGHSAWMLANATQSHYETNPTNDPFTRMLADGFSYSSAGENVYAAAKSVWYGHAGFEVDWGSGSGGMQNPRGHRANIHNATFREIGVGVVFGTNGATGPQLVTQDFGTSASNPTLATGVAYYDLNSNNQYDVGEGIAGLTVNVSGADVTGYCATAIGGGWVVPVPATAATRTVTFSGLNVNQNVNLVIPASTNAKADLKLTYLAPAITSSASAVADVPLAVTFNPVGGATSYKWNRWTSSAAAPENCESIVNITASTTGTYTILNTNVKQQGAASFHLANSTASSQWLQLNTIYYGLTSPSLAFQSSVRYATNSEKFKVQIKEEGGVDWQDVYSQTGTNGPGESVFNPRTAALTGMTGKAFRVRFLLSYGGGGYYGSSGDSVGWFIDAITFSGVAALGNNTSATLAGTSGSFTPAAGTYLISVAPVISDREFPAAYQTLTVSSDDTTAPQITTQPVSVTINSGGTATFTVTASGTSPAFQWYAGTSGNTANPVSGATGNSFTTPALTTTAGYWVRASNAAGTSDSQTATATVGGIINAGISLISLGNLTAAYNGSAKPVTATTTPAGLPVTITYNGSSTAPRNAGTYAVVATVNNANYHGTATGTLVISKATATVTLGRLAATYNGSAKAVTAITTPTGLAMTFTYDGLTAAPRNVGSYAVVATINNANYQGGATGTLVISKGTATVKLGALAATYNGLAKPVTVLTSPAGLAVILTYNGSLTPPTNAGSYSIVATVNNPNYQGGATSTLVISKATAAVKPGNLVATYSGNPILPTATTTPAGLAVVFICNGLSAAPTNVGSYAIVATINDTNYKGSATGTLVISKATAMVTLGNLTATYDGTAKSVTATTVPGGLAVRVTYNGSATAPTNVGSYAVAATINTANYKGGTTGTLVVSKAVASTPPGNTQLSNNTNQAGTSSFAAWAAAKELSNGLVAGTIANHPDGDYDHDGRANLLKYAFGTSPVIANDPAPRMLAASSTATPWVLRYQRDTALTDLTFTAQASVDLKTWKAPGETGAPDGFADRLISTSGTLETREASIPRASCGNAYIRVRVTSK